MRKPYIQIPSPAGPKVLGAQCCYSQGFFATRVTGFRAWGWFEVYSSCLLVPFVRRLHSQLPAHLPQATCPGPGGVKMLCSGTDSVAEPSISLSTKDLPKTTQSRHIPSIAHAVDKLLSSCVCNHSLAARWHSDASLFLLQWADPNPVARRPSICGGTNAPATILEWVGIAPCSNMQPWPEDENKEQEANRQKRKLRAARLPRELVLLVLILCTRLLHTQRSVVFGQSRYTCRCVAVLPGPKLPNILLVTGCMSGPSLFTCSVY